MNMARTTITLVTVMPRTADIAEALAELNREYNTPIEMKLFSVNEIEQELVEDDVFKASLMENDIVLIDVRGGNRTAAILQDVLPKTNNTVIVLVGGSTKIMRLTRMGSFNMDTFMSIRDRRILKPVMRWMTSLFIAKGFDMDEMNTEVIYDTDKLWRMMNHNPIMNVSKFFPVGPLRHLRNWTQAIQYWSYRDKQNLKNILIHVAANYGHLKAKAKPPMIQPDMGIYHPEAPHFFRSLDAYRKWRKGDKRKTVGILLYGGMHFGDSRPTTDFLIKALEEEANVIPFYTNNLTYWKGMEKFFFQEGRPTVDAVLHVLWWRLNGGPLGGSPLPTLTTLQKLDVPVLMTSIMAMNTIDNWEKSQTGLSPLDLIGAVTMPELDGCIEPIPSCGIADCGFDTGLGAAAKNMTVIEDRCLKIARRTLNWIRLKQKQNKDKKVAVILYNYPPGEGSLGGGAAYLDVFQSLIALLHELGRQGYNINGVPQSKEELVNLFVTNGLVNSAEWTALQSSDCLKVSKTQYEEWLRETPEVFSDKMMETWGAPPGDIMTYRQEIFIPGVILGNIFVGLQPTRGVHENPQLACHDRNIPPHHQYLAFYRFIEKQFAADAVIHFGTHGTLEFTPGKEVGLSKNCSPDVLIGDLPNLYVYWIGNTSEATIAKRRSYATMISHMSPLFTTSGLYDNYADLEDLIHEYNEAESKNAPMAETIRQKLQGKAENINLTGSVAEIQDKLFEMKRSIIPRGLHVLGQRYSEEDLVEFITFVLRYNRGNIKSLHKIVASSRGYDYDHLLKHPEQSFQEKTYTQVLEEIEAEASLLVKSLVQNRAVNIGPSEARQTLTWALDLIKRYESSDEIGGVLHGLDAGYIVPNHGGDPIRSPEVLPTGGNIYQFNPFKIPTATAYERGSQIAEQMVDAYTKTHGEYPESVGIVLWGFETMNTNGETIGQIMRLIGVRPILKEGGHFPELAVIPLEELGRPRIDVVMTICGIFRDTFPNLIELMDRAFKLISELGESEERNLIAKHSKELRQLGVEERVSHLRMFGPTTSEYGTSLTTLIETSSWQDETQLTDAYISSMENLYGHNIHARSTPKLFRHLASSVQLCSQIRDHHEYEVSDLDHYYEFLGGLSSAVERFSGEKPEILLTDTAQEVVNTQDLADAINHGVRTRTCNPKWIDSMLDHGYDGVLNVSHRVEYVLGLAATTNKVENWVWEDITDRIALNDDVRQRMAEANPWATAKLIERLLEAEKRGYWEASEDRLKELREVYLEIEGDLEDRT